MLRAYHTLRAVPVTAGRHDVVMWYEAGVLRAGFLSSVLGLSVLVATVGIALVAR